MDPLTELTQPRSRFPIEKVFLMSLGLAFIVLKLCKVIDWPWWAVLVPLWIFPAMVALFLFLVIFAMLCITGAKRINRYWRYRHVGKNQR